jgi:hypothetical protein
MVRFLLIVSLFFLHFTTFAQVAGGKGFSKEIALYKAKEYVIKSILQDSQDVVEFEIDPLAASSSGELTSLAYRCDKKNVEGLILGFFGGFWNDSGTRYLGYAFRNLSKDDALRLFEKIDAALNDHKKYMNNNVYENNIYFDFEDLTFNISSNLNSGYHIRVFWDEYDAEWTTIAFNRTKKRFEKKLDK